MPHIAVPCLVGAWLHMCPHSVKNDVFGSHHLPCMLSMYPGDLRGVLWLILTEIRSRIAQKYTPSPPSSVHGMLGHKWHILARS